MICGNDKGVKSMRDDVNYRQRAEVTRKILMESLSVSDFARHRSEYNWINTQKQLLNKGELPKDRKQFLDSILPKWDYDTDVLLDSMHALKVKELYNQGYSDLKLFSEVSNIGDAYILAYSGINDVKTLMNIPVNLLLVKNINNDFLFNLQRKLREGVFKPTKRAFNLAQAISRTQFGILREWESTLYFHHLSKYWLFDKVEYTYDLTPRKLGLFNFCSPSYYDEKTGEIKMIYTPNDVRKVVVESNANDSLGCNTILTNLPKTWNNPGKLNELLCHKQYDIFLTYWLQSKDNFEMGRKPKRGLWDPNSFVAPPADEFSTPAPEHSSPAPEYSGSGAEYSGSGSEFGGSGGEFGGDCDGDGDGDE
jgi:hypothetical protein